MKKILSLLSFAFLLSFFSFGQGQTGAPIYETITVPMCHEAADGTQTSYTIFQVIKLGDDAACVTKTLASDGTEFTVPAGGISKEGYCITPLPTPDCELTEWCDDGVPFFKIFNISKNIDGTTTVTVLNVNETGAVYVPSGNEGQGACSLCVEATAVTAPSNSTTTGTLAADLYQYVTITNCGCENGTYTIGGSTVPLYVGQSYTFEAFKNPITNEWKLNAATDWDATNTEFCIVTTAK